MHLILRYPNGKRADALLLSSGDGIMRVVVRDWNETLEFRLVSKLWTGETGEHVCIEAMLAGPYQGGRQTNTKYTTVAAVAKTAAAAMHSMSAGELD